VPVKDSPLPSQCEVERSSLSDDAFRPYFPAMPPDNPLHNRQADSGSRELARAVEPLERCEQLAA